MMEETEYIDHTEQVELDNSGPDPLDEVFVESPKKKVKDPKKVAMGKKYKSAGNTFEVRVRNDLIEKGWVVDKWRNNVEFATKKEEFEESQISSIKARIIYAKNRFLGPGKPVMLGAGFPDLLAFRRQHLGGGKYDFCYDVIGVEVKTKGKLSKLEKQKCKFMLTQKIFNRILVASKTKVGRKIVIHYEELDITKL